MTVALNYIYIIIPRLDKYLATKYGKDFEEHVIDSDNIQFCSAEWFWKRQINSYALQVEPDRFKHKDKVTLNYEEAMAIERIKEEFFIRLKELISNTKSKKHNR